MAKKFTELDRELLGEQFDSISMTTKDGGLQKFKILDNDEEIASAKKKLRYHHKYLLLSEIITDV